MEALKPRELIKQAKTAQERLNQLNKEDEELRDSTYQETRRIEFDVYGPQLRALNGKCYAEVRDLKAKEEKREREIREEYHTASAPIAWVKKVIAYLRLPRSAVSLLDEEVKCYHDKKVVPAGFLLNDNYMKLKVYIIENDKPTNKYSLVVLGRTTFVGEEFAKWPRCYGLSLQGSYAIERVIKDAPSISTLTSYLAKNQSEITKTTMGDYMTLKSEYLTVIQNYTIEDFKPLATFTCPDCGYFGTILDTYTERWCPVCLKNISEVKA